MHAVGHPMLFPIFILLLMIQTGCGAVGVDRESAAEYTINSKNEGPGTRFELKGHAENHRRFGLMGIIVPFVPYWSSPGDKHEFTLYLTISPGTHDDVSLDARQVVLLTEGGESISPSKVVALIDTEDSHDRSLHKAAAGSFKISKQVFVELVFPILPLSADHKFSLVLSGLTWPGQPRESPKLNFRQQTSITVGYTYGLLCPHCKHFIDAKWIISR